PRDSSLPPAPTRLSHRPSDLADTRIRAVPAATTPYAPTLRSRAPSSAPSRTLPSTPWSVRVSRAHSRPVGAATAASIPVAIVPRRAPLETHLLQCLIRDAYAPLRTPLHRELIDASTSYFQFLAIMGRQVEEGSITSPTIYPQRGSAAALRRAAAPIEVVGAVARPRNQPITVSRR